MADIITNIEFFKRLMAEDKISQSQKDELWLLMKNELIKDKQTKETSMNPYVKNLEFHQPQKVQKYLTEFSLDSSPMKWLVHNIDIKEFKNYDDIINPIKDKDHYTRWKNLKSLDKELWWNIIYPFCFQEKLNKNNKPFGWGKENVKIGWRYPDTLKKWCYDNFDNIRGNDKNKLPFEMTLPKELRPHMAYNSFESIAQLFTEEIRYDNEDLRDVIDRLSSKVLKQHKVENNIRQVRKIFIHTNKVNKAIERCFKMISKRTENPNVKISCVVDENQSKVFLNIVHIGSRSAENPYKNINLKGKGGDISALINQLKNVCDFSIKGKFKDESKDTYQGFKIDYLYPGVKKDPECKKYPNRILTELDSQSHLQGFTYSFGFYID